MSSRTDISRILLAAGDPCPSSQFAGFPRGFARRFFEAVRKGGRNNKIGKVLFRLRREFVDEFNSPLGLIYTLHRGADGYVERSVAQNDD